MTELRIPIDVLIYEEMKKQEEIEKDKRIELEIEKYFQEIPENKKPTEENPTCIIIQM